MTDNTIPADKIREIIDAMKDTIDNDQSQDAVERARDDSTVYWRDFLTSLLPVPRTLADELRDAIKDFGKGKIAALSDGAVEWWEADYLSALRVFADRVEALENELKSRDETPALPDGWRLADHQERGRVIVTKPTPDRYGYVYYAFPTDALSGGCGWHYCDPAVLTFLDTDQ